MERGVAAITSFIRRMEISVTCEVALALVSALLVFLLVLLEPLSQNRPPIPLKTLSTVLPAFLLSRKNIHDEITKTHRVYKTWRSTLLLPFNYVFTVDPANVEYVLKTNFFNFRKGKGMKERFEDMTGNGMLFEDGEHWKNQRKVAVREFSAAVLRDPALCIFREAAIKLSKVFVAACASGKAVEIQTHLMSSSVEVLAKLVYGIDIAELFRDNPGLQEAFAEAYEKATSVIFWRHFNRFWRLARFLNIRSEASMKTSLRAISDFCSKIIARRLQTTHPRDGLEPKGNFLAYFMDLVDNDPKHFSWKYAQDAIMTFIVAGKETTTIALSCFIYLICKHPDIQQKIVQEVEEVMNPRHCRSLEESIQKFSESLTRETLNKMQYLQACLSESLRLYPPFPALPRYVESDDVLPDGHRVKKGDIITISVLSMGRMPFLWGGDAEKFKPERWLDSRGVFQPESPFKYTAFPGGRRTCLGKDFSFIQMKMLASIFIYFFEMEIGQGSDVSFKVSLSLDLDGEGLKLQVKPRTF